MIDKNNGNSPDRDSSHLVEKDKIEISNFKLLYRNTSNPERDKTSEVSSDEETTSSSLVPIPDTLKQIKNKSRWTVREAAQAPEQKNPYSCETVEKSAGNIMNSLEELRKKYTLKNESSVTMKMNSANMILDDILSSTKMSNGCTQPNFFKEQDLRPKSLTENESSSTESSVTHNYHCPHILNHSHVPVSMDYFPPPNHRHCSSVQQLHDSLGSTIKDFNPQSDPKKKSFLEKINDLKIKYKILSVYKTFRKTKNPFGKKEDPLALNVQQGIPGAGYQGNSVTENESSICQFEHISHPLSQCPKKMILDLVEFSEVCHSNSKNTTEDCQCTSKNLRERCNCTCIKEKDCKCPEIIPKCVCVEHTYKASEVYSESPKDNSSYSESSNKSIEQTQTTQLIPPGTKKNNQETSMPIEETNQNNNNQKTHSVCQKGWKKYCSKQRNLIERTDIYYFDHGNSAYYQTTDSHPIRCTEFLVERTDEYATRFWAEIFGTIEIGIAFLISFILQLYRFLFTSVIRSLTVGLLQIFSDYFFKPFLTILFNGIIQPCLILGYNIATSGRDLCLPISEAFGFFTKQIANILRSCRFVEISHGSQSACYCGNKA